MTCMKCGSDQVASLADDGKKKRPGAIHWYCRKCGAHYYRGQWWTKAEWFGWKNNG